MDMPITDQTRQRLVLVLGGMVILQAILGLYLLSKGDDGSATVVFSGIAATAASMAAVSQAGTDRET